MENFLKSIYFLSKLTCLKPSLVALLLVVLPLSFHAQTNTIDSLLLLLKSNAVDVEEKAVIHSEIAFLFQLDDPGSAYYHANKGLQKAGEIESAKAMAKNLVQLGYYYYLLDSLDLALEYYHRATSYFNEETDLLDQVRTWNVLGSIASDQSDYYQATVNYLRALSIAESMQDSMIIASISNNLGILYEDLGEQDEAYAQYKRSAEMFEVIGDTQQLGYALNNMMKFQIDRRQYDSARRSFARAMPLFALDKDQYGLANLHFNMARIHFAEDSLLAARMDIERGLKAANQLGTFQRGNLNENGFYLLGRLMFLEGDYRPAIDYLKRSYDLARENHHLEYIALTADLLVMSYAQLGMIDSTVFYHKEYIVYNDSLTKLKNDREIARVRYEAAMIKEKENFQMQKELLAERSAYRNRIIILVSVSVLAVLLMIILYLRFRMKRNMLVRQNILLSNKNLAEQLESKNKELAAQLLYLEQKNNLIISIAGELKKIVPNAKTENKKKILDTVRKLEKGHFAKNWEEFDMLFREIHSDFYSKLNKKFPNLTPNEQKLCVFLYLNMSSKQIAGITYQSYESIRMGRHRLRKKLNVESDKHLVSFLNQL